MQSPETEYRQEFLNRTLPFLTAKGEKSLQKKRVAIAGCGGVGGVAALTLARLGVGCFTLADPGRFDMPDINRQVGANSKTLGKNKAKIYAQLLKNINPHIKVTEFTQGVTEKNVPAFLDGADLLIDCLDLSVSKELRKQMFQCARHQQIYSFTAPVLGFGSVICCSDPKGESMDSFVDMLGSSQDKASMPDFLYRIFMPEHLDVISKWLNEKKTKVPSTAIGPMIAGSIVSTEAIQALIGSMVLGGRTPIALPQITFVDLFRMSHTIINVAPMLSKGVSGNEHDS